MKGGRKRGEMENMGMEKRMQRRAVEDWGEKKLGWLGRRKKREKK